MDDQLHVAGLDAGFGNDRAHDRKHPGFRSTRGGQALGGITAIADFERQVGECATDIDAEPDCGRGCHERTAEKDQTTKAALYAGSLPGLSIALQRPALAKTCISKDLH
jgi:hypothetical protein